MTERTLIIAEAGVNHNGDIEIAKALVDAAVTAGADLVKFQTFTADRLVTHSSRKADYQLETTDSGQSHYEMLSQLELSKAMHEELFRYCNVMKIGFFSTGFDIQSVDYLYSLGLRVFKVPSGEITNLPYLRHIGALDVDIIMSTGMSTLGEIESALQVLLDAGTDRERISVLLCTSKYPTPIQDVNLRAMRNIGSCFNLKFGYSDHTAGIEVAIAAVALGATIIEKHFTLDKTMDGPDHQASLEPHELSNMVSAIRNIEKALGDGVKRVSLEEKGNLKVARKVIVAKTFIKAGEIFSSENLTTMRSNGGISPMEWDNVLGKCANLDIQKHEPIKLDSFR
jgi:N,N'-diacetyllegionaminate synthase